MKTPIPEKIKPQYDKLGFPTGTWMTINSLIDVVTEQQKEIEAFKTDFINHCVVDTSVAHSYTAIRSTGEFCKCKEPHVTDSAGMDIVHCISCGKEPSPLKPQEDIREKLIKLLKIVDNSVAHKPYTAMRSIKLCGCTCHTEGKYRCFTCTYNHIEPQEHVKIYPNTCGCIKTCWSLPRIRKTYCACKHGIVET